MRLPLPILVVAILLSVPVVAAEGASTLVSIDDPAGDVASLAPPQATGFIDLVQAKAEAREEALGFQVSVADLATETAAPFGWEIGLDLSYEGASFQVVLVLGPTDPNVPAEVRRLMWGEARADVYRLDPDGAVALADNLPASTDLAQRSFNTTVSWSTFVTATGLTPSPGEPVRIVSAYGLWDATFAGGPRQPTPVSITGVGAFDEAAFPEGTFLTMPGSTGALSLATPLALRSSNGEATTFHWPVTITNRGATDLDVIFSLEAGDGEGRIPPGLHLAAGANATFHTYVSVPFVHEHGSTRAFPLVATAGGESATLRLGVDYPAIPQPSGHHPNLYLHAASQAIQGQVPLMGSSWMNNLEDDPRASATTLEAGTETCPEGALASAPVFGDVPDAFDWGAAWTIGLDPGLAVGIDGRVGERAGLDVSLVAREALPAGQLHGRLMLSTDDLGDRGPFANTTDDTRGSVAVAATNGPSTSAVHLDIPVPPSLDFVPPARGQNLVLRLLFCPDTPGAAGAAATVGGAFAAAAMQGTFALASGGHLVLPFDDYHDLLPVTSGDASLSLHVADAVRRAAPGATVLWTPRVDFADTAAGPHVVRLFGSGAKDAQLLGPDGVEAPADVDLPVRFVVPDVAAGTTIDLLLDVTHATDPTKSAGLRLAVVVDPTATQDDAGLAGQAEDRSRDTPMPSLALLGLALLVAARRRRA